MKSLLKSMTKNTMFSAFGFTLIELLAVIIILAIVVLISVPIVLNVTKEAREQGDLRTVDGMIDGGKQYCANAIMNDTLTEIVNHNIYKEITVSGKKPKDGKIFVRSDCEIAARIIIDDKCYIKPYGGNVEVTDDLNCEIGYVGNDTSAPEVSFTILGTPFNNNGWSNVDVKIKVSLIDEDSGPKSYKWCSTTNETCTPSPEIIGFEGYVDLVVNSEKNKICVESVDNVGNTGVKCSKNYKIDKDKPKIETKPSEVIITSGDNFNSVDYFTLTYSISGGVTTCDPTNTSSLAVGNQTLTCTATGLNGLSVGANKSITVKEKYLVENLTTKLNYQYQASNVTGLLNDATGYYYKGTPAEVSNNFVWYEGHLWRIITINKDNTVTMVTQQPITAISPTTAVWTTEQEYKDSYINTWLNDVFYNSITDKSKIQTNTFNVGLHNNIAKTTTNQVVGLLDEKQYEKAGSTWSFLDIKDTLWLGNVIDLDGVSFVNDRGIVDYHMLTLAFGLRPVIKISDLTITAGEGTLANPFRESSKSTNTSNIRVGEYISVPGGSTFCKRKNELGKCLFRVVSKDADSVKVILNGLLPQKSSFAARSNVTFSASGKIYAPLSNFANSIPNAYRYTANKDFNVGAYGAGGNYKTVNSVLYSGAFGLATVGEMFSGNDIDLSLSMTKTFVNPSTIENPSIDYFAWVMNPYDSINVHYVHTAGHLDQRTPDIISGVRPVIFLNKGTNSDLTFTRGDGTAENPYRLGN